MSYSEVARNQFIMRAKLQRDWIEGRAFWLLAAIYFGGLGGGLFIVSVLADWRTGLLIGLGITAILKGGAHLLFLTHPWKFWRIFQRPQTSWISRGIYFVFGFLVFGFAYYVAGGFLFKLLSIFFALCLVIYTGFVLLASRPISFWNNPLLPILFVSVSLASGVSLAETIEIVAPQAMGNPGLLAAAGPWGIGITAFLLFVYLAGNFYASVTAKESLMRLLKGPQASLFYGGVVLLGLLVPLAIFSAVHGAIVPTGALAVAGICELTGAFILRYLILKVGISAPVAS